MFAVLANQPKTVNLLLQRGASFNIMDTDKITALKIAVFKGHCECTQFLISASKNKINRNMCENWSSEIILAVRNNHTDCLSNIIEAGFNTEVRDEDGMTPLICAIITLNTDIFDLLISKGTSVNFTAGEGKTPLMAAAWVGDVHMLTNLVRLKADVNSIDCNGYTALMFSCKEGHLECVKCLVESGADVDKENNFGETALDIAIYNGHTECADALHLKKQNDIFEIGKNTLFNVSCSALLEATFNGEETRLQKILNEGVSTDEKNKALLVASALGRLQFLKLLIRNGAEVNVCDTYGVTPLMESAMGDHVDCLSELINHKADLDIQNINGATALMLAAMYGHEKCLKMLIRSKSKLIIQDNDGLSALMHATKQNGLKCVEILLEAKASVWPRDKESNNTVTMYAAERGFADCLKLLLKHNAPRYCPNNKFLSAYQLAQRNNHTECCEILK
ncbi:ankyrin repeat domain-containing protein 29-like [Physella acuta]|uniref:ankyrin repeat domain-containing protein 29-like n=1 Tax=Physella acuta TaxID=109671 RepID=UPI0027DBD724|nr:ankyrin repeat domain-containing protein 29-like [Physella acuta]